MSSPKAGAASSSALRLRLISRVLVVALVVAIGVVILARDRLTAGQSVVGTRTSATFKGINLGGIPAPVFTLADQDGKQVSLAALAGRPVVVTFLYTHCPDECPLTAEKLHTAALALGDRASSVAWLAVSIDPVGDTPQTARGFVANHHLSGTLRYLLGTQAQLRPIWSAYYIAVERADVPAGTTTPQTSGLAHNAAVYLLDTHGREQVLYMSAFAPDDLVSDLRTFLAR